MYIRAPHPQRTGGPQNRSSGVSSRSSIGARSRIDQCSPRRIAATVPRLIPTRRAIFVWLRPPARSIAVTSSAFAGDTIFRSPSHEIARSAVGGGPQIGRKEQAALDFCKRRPQENVADSPAAPQDKKMTACDRRRKTAGQLEGATLARPGRRRWATIAPIVTIAPAKQNPSDGRSSVCLR
jgi:hypothetical protein